LILFPPTSHSVFLTTFVLSWFHLKRFEQRKALDVIYGTSPSVCVFTKSTNHECFLSAPFRFRLFRAVLPVH
jgi:hypothetical protein